MEVADSDTTASGRPKRKSTLPTHRIPSARSVPRLAKFQAQVFETPQVKKSKPSKQYPIINDLVSASLDGEQIANESITVDPNCSEYLQKHVTTQKPEGQPEVQGTSKDLNFAQQALLVISDLKKEILGLREMTETRFELLETNKRVATNKETELHKNVDSNMSDARAANASKIDSRTTTK